MKILVLDVYPNKPWRVSKDTNGGYGTANRYGDGLVSRLLTFLAYRTLDWPPLNAVYTAGVLREKGHSVEYQRQWLGCGDYDLVLVTSSIVSHETEIISIRQIERSGIRVGVIGPFATSMPGPYTEAGAFVIAGEPEMYFREVPLDRESLSGLKGVIPVTHISDLDDLPLPAWDIVYATAPTKFGLIGKKEVALPITATRGCPYSCRHYCVYPLQQGQKVRVRDPEKIVEEMAHWQDTLNASRFVFRDPVFSINRKHTVALCEEIKKSGRKFKLIIETHLNNIDEELAKLLIDCGLEMVKVGIESVNSDTISEAKRFSIDSDLQKDRIRMLEDQGVIVTCFYILGMPGDTPARFQSTMKYARKINSVFAQISVFTPYPGTPAFPEFASAIKVKKFEKFTQFDLVFEHEAYTPRQVRSLLSKAYRNYYLRPSWLLKYFRARFL